MNNLAKILEKIEAEGTRQVEAIQKERDEKLAMLEAEKQSTIAAREAENARAIEKDTAAIRARASANTAMRCREIVLTEKAAQVASVYAQAEKALLSLPTEEYAAFLAGLAASAIVERVQTVQFMQTEYRDEAFAEADESYTLHFSGKDKAAYGVAVLQDVQKQVAAQLSTQPQITLGEETMPISGGVVVRYGDTETNCALSVLLSGLREKLDPVVQKTLFACE